MIQFLLQFLYGLIIFGAGYLTALYRQYLKTKHDTNEEPKETRA